MCGELEAKSQIKFVKEGESKPETTRKGNNGLLNSANDWVVETDLGKRLQFPEEIVETSQRPDMLIKSKLTKTIIIIELTCPSEEKIQERHEFKLAWYEDLAKECRDRGWKTHLFAVEVGARGYAAESLSSCLKRLGFKWRVIKRVSSKMADASLRSSFWIWLLRKDANWSTNKFRDAKDDNVPHQVDKEVIEELDLMEQVEERQRFTGKQTEDQLCTNSQNLRKEVGQVIGELQATGRMHKVGKAEERLSCSKDRTDDQQKEEGQVINEIRTSGRMDEAQVNEISSEQTGDQTIASQNLRKDVERVISELRAKGRKETMEKDKSFMHSQNLRKDVRQVDTTKQADDDHSREQNEDQPRNNQVLRKDLRQVISELQATSEEDKAGKAKEGQNCTKQSGDQLLTKNHKRDVEQVITELRATGERKMNSKVVKPKPTSEQNARHTATGLLNLGNTCFMNSVMQCMRAIVKKGNIPTCHSQVEHEFLELINKLEMGQKKAIDPRQFKYIMSRIWTPLAGGRQQDAHEFLVFLLDHLPGLEQQVTGELTTMSVCQGCSHESKQAEVFKCLSVGIPKQKQGRLLMQDCIDEATKPEMVEDWNCEECRTRGTVVRRTQRFSCYPQTLIVHLKRFEAVGTRWRKDLRNIIASKDLLVGEGKYKLVGMVNHTGATRHSGHYTAKISIKGKWQLCDDRNVSRVEGRTESTNGYLFFYCKQ